MIYEPSLHKSINPPRIHFSEMVRWFNFFSEPLCMDWPYGLDDFQTTPYQLEQLKPSFRLRKTLFSYCDLSRQHYKSKQQGSPSTSANMSHHKIVCYSTEPPCPLIVSSLPNTTTLLTASSTSKFFSKIVGVLQLCSFLILSNEYRVIYSVLRKGWSCFAFLVVMDSF